MRLVRRRPDRRDDLAARAESLVEVALGALRRRRDEQHDGRGQAQNDASSLQFDAPSLWRESMPTGGLGARARYEESVSTAIWAVSVGLVPTRTPFASSASFFAWAVPEEPEMIAPAWPICLPSGAVKPAM